MICDILRLSDRILGVQGLDGGLKRVLAERQGCVRVEKEEHGIWRAEPALRRILDVEPKEERTEGNHNQMRHS